MERWPLRRWQQYGYTFDTIGNRTSTATNGRTESYTPNLLNQYSSRTVAGAADVFGFADPDATVSVDGQRATQQAGGYFHRAAPVANSASAAQGKCNVRGIKNFTGANSEDAQRDEVRTAFVPKTPEVFTYDLDGNLTGDGRFTYTWDAENRLVSVEALANLPAAAKTKAQYSYDGFSRHISKKAWRWIDAGSGSQPSPSLSKKGQVKCLRIW